MKGCIGACAVCLRKHENIGYSPNERSRVAWVCDDCLPVARKAYHMPKKHLDVYELKAMQAGGEKAGEYLDTIGKTDLAELELHEWLEMWRVGLDGYGNSMRDMLKNGEAPF